MKITAFKLIGVEWARRACNTTMNRNLSNDARESKISLKKLYECEHSPMYTQMFWIEMIGIPNYVHVHFRTHSAHATHFVESNRHDRKGSRDLGREMPVNHSFLCNAKTLVDMARKRLCNDADEKTQMIMNEIRKAVKEVDPDLSAAMKPECLYSHCRSLRKNCKGPKYDGGN